MCPILMMISWIYCWVVFLNYPQFHSLVSKLLIEINDVIQGEDVFHLAGCRHLFQGNIRVKKEVVEHN